ncbi:hypothetical protein PPACK8108_LOCUS1931 [Phakopsora pachyrhizi]|uniref:RFX-type winged-helix domain-containing protein n=1 Tax=Phakopsora pachyrhizi TaxID=170000 RepID=A0AAV0AJP6_PHAPC|nr:hypothetical protein PPACK8108_LOCUS1931 [Phakopsora pachyrhizi]
MSSSPPLSVQVGDTTITTSDLLVGQYLRRVLRLPEPSRTRAWIATMFEADPEGEIEQVALWGMYRMQFEPHQAEDGGAPIPPLAAATDVITVMETVFRPDSYVGSDGMKRYVIRGLRLRPAIERDAVLDDMFRGPAESSPAATTPSAHHQSYQANNTSSTSAMVTTNNNQSTLNTPPTAMPSTTPRSTDLLDEPDVLKIVNFPEPYRTRLWIASLFEPDPTSNAGPGGGGVEQVTLWQLYQKQLTTYVVDGAVGDKVVPPLAPATEVIKAVQDVFPEGRVVKGLLQINGSKASSTSHNGSNSHSSQPDPMTVQLMSKVEALAKTVDELQNVIKQQEISIKQELAWNATRQINLHASESNSALRPLCVGPPNSLPSYPVDFPKTVEEANKLDYSQCAALLERYGQKHLASESNQEKTRLALLDFIGCQSTSNQSSFSTLAVTSMV